MKPLGWLFMLGSWTLISCLAGWCIYRLLRNRDGGK
jgi:hypothetical protein